MSVSKILRWIERTPAAFLFRKVLFGQILFHEIGHHIHRTIRPEHKEKEDVADSWAGKLNVNFVRKNYWYAVPFITVAAKTYQLLRRKKRGLGPLEHSVNPPSDVRQHSAHRQ